MNLKIVLAAFLICLLTGIASAQSIPGIAQSAPQSWIGNAIIGRDVASGGDVPDLALPSVAGATEAIFQYEGTNGSGGTRWVQLFKANTVPANGTTPIQEITVSSGQSFGEYGYPIASLTATGFVIACSTTQGQLTLTTTNDCFISAKVSP